MGTFESEMFRQHVLLVRDVTNKHVASLPKAANDPRAKAAAQAYMQARLHPKCLVRVTCADEAEFVDTYMRVWACADGNRMLDKAATLAHDKDTEFVIELTNGAGIEFVLAS
jgi:hypothetical protein